jgi:hypothetical protein
MRPELERLWLIEQQLLHGPAADWHLRRLLDPDLDADTDAQQQLYHGLRLAGQRQLRQELAAIHARLYAREPHRWLAWPRRAGAWLRARWRSVR